MKSEGMVLTLGIAFIVLVVAGMFGLKALLKLDIARAEIQALQAQVDKKYCEGEVTYPQLKKGLEK